MLGSVWSLSTSENLLHFTDEDRRRIVNRCVHGDPSDIYGNTFQCGRNLFASMLD